MTLFDHLVCEIVKKEEVSGNFVTFFMKMFNFVTFFIKFLQNCQFSAHVTQLSLPADLMVNYIYLG